MENSMNANALLGLSAGVGLSAACGFRVFVPLLIAGIAARSGQVELSEGFQWVGTWPALIAFGSATALEVGGYYIPWLDNALDTITSPASVVAGTVVTASFMPEMAPMMKWTTAAIMGGGAAGTVQAATVLVRGASTATSGGLGNSIVSTFELGSSAAASIVALFIPILIFLVLLIVVIFVIRVFYRRLTRKPVPVAAAPGEPPPTGAG